MAIGREGRFDYVVRVPHAGASALPWTARLREPLATTERRLVGHAPRVELEEFEPRPGGHARHRGMRSDFAYWGLR